MHRNATSLLGALLVASLLVRFAHAASTDATDASSSAPRAEDASAARYDGGARDSGVVLDAAWAPTIDWMHIPIGKYQTSLVGYQYKVRPGNQTALGGAMLDYVRYLNAMHNRIHVLFSDRFLAQLAHLPATEPLNDPKLVVSLELVLDVHGRIDSLGVVRSSGVLQFDIAALEAVTRAAPYGDTPASILSPDGKSYVHWEFHRNETFACWTMNARPFILSIPDASVPVDSSRWITL